LEKNQSELNQRGRAIKTETTWGGDLQKAQGLSGSNLHSSQPGKQFLGGLAEVEKKTNLKSKKEDERRKSP